MFRKQKNSSKPVEHVWSQDPAIDREHPDFDFEKYQETGDETFLPLKGGGKPCKFFVRGLQGDAREYADSIIRRQGNEDPLHWIRELCAVGVVGVEAEFEDNTPVDLSRYMERDKEHRITRLSSEGMAMLFAAGATEEFPKGSLALIYELGVRVQRETYGDPLSRKGSS